MHNTHTQIGKLVNDSGADLCSKEQRGAYLTQIKGQMALTPIY